jgi:hypothetical protein
MSDNTNAGQKRLTVRLDDEENAAVEDLAHRWGCSVNRVFKILARMTGVVERHLAENPD